MANPVAMSRIAQALGFRPAGGAGGTRRKKPSSWSLGLAAAMGNLSPRMMAQFAKEGQMQDIRPEEVALAQRKQNMAETYAPWQYMINPELQREMRRDIEEDKLEYGYDEMESRLKQTVMREQGATKRTKMQERRADQRAQLADTGAARRARMQEQAATRRAEARKSFEKEQREKDRKLKALGLQLKHAQGNKELSGQIIREIHNVWRDVFPNSPEKAGQATMMFLQDQGYVVPPKKTGPQKPKKNTKDQYESRRGLLNLWLWD
jgi:hypothetical protein